MINTKNSLLVTLTLFAVILSRSISAAVFNIGDAEIINGMSIQPLYIQSVRVEGEDPQAMDHSNHQMGSTNADMSHHDHSDPSMHADGNAHAGGHNMEGDLHLEVDVKATGDNDWGFPKDAWIPYLNIHYTVKKTYQNFETSGVLIPMVANDGPHYGNNVKLDGPGKYTVKIHVSPPRGSVFMRHFDRETGVDAWWKPFEFKRQFTFIGVGKKGGY